MGGLRSRALGVSWRAARVFRRSFAASREAWAPRLATTVLAPLLCVLAFGHGLGRAVGEVRVGEGAVPYGEFVLPGLVAAFAFAKGFHGTIRAGRGGIAGGRTLEAILTAPLTLGDAVLGEALWRAATAAAAAAIVLAAAPAAGLAVAPRHALALPVAAVAGFLFSSVGILAAALVRRRESLVAAEILVGAPAILFSGALFPLDVLPGWAAILARASPLAHVVELARAGMTGAAPPDGRWSALYVAAAAAALFLAALGAARRRWAR